MDILRAIANKSPRIYTLLYRRIRNKYYSICAVCSIMHPVRLFRVCIRNKQTQNITVAIHTTFIPRENILFLREWIEHYKLLGVNEFYLYNNDGVQVPNSMDQRNPNLVLGQINKYGVPYADIVSLSDDEISQMMLNIEQDIDGVHFIQWTPRDENGKIRYAQERAMENARNKMRGKIDWLLMCDMDEYLVLPGNIQELCNSLDANGCSVGYISTVNMADRWRMLDKLVLENTMMLRDSERPDYWQAKKYLCKPDIVARMHVHDVRGLHVRKWVRKEEAVILHYNIPQTDNDECRFSTLKWALPESHYEALKTKLLSYAE